MRAGKLRHRIEIQEPFDARDSHGGHSTEWRSLAIRWGSVEPLRGRELFEARQVEARVTTRVKMRHYDGLTPKHRLSFDSDIYNITAVLNPDSRNAEVEVLCEKGD